MSRIAVKKKYLSRDNKGIIWGVLLENKLFDGLNNSQQVLNQFENQIQKISEEIVSNDSIISLNKRTINNMVGYIKRIKENRKSNTNFASKNFALPNSSSSHTIEDIMKERRDRFKKQLNAKQEEFKRTIQGNTPKAIDFSDKTKESSIDMDRKLSELMEKRGMNYLPKKEDLKKATSWIQNGGDIQSTPIQLQIGEQVELNDVNDFKPVSIYKQQNNAMTRNEKDALPKRVRFKDDKKINKSKGFLDMLKPKKKLEIVEKETQTDNNSDSRVNTRVVEKETQTEKQSHKGILSNENERLNTLLNKVLEKINTMEEKINELKIVKREIEYKKMFDKSLQTTTIINKNAETNTNDIEERIKSPKNLSKIKN